MRYWHENAGELEHPSEEKLRYDNNGSGFKNTEDMVLFLHIPHCFMREGDMLYVS